MPTKYKDYPVYTYDEPVTYSDFSGGINTDPSNEHLLANEMRDCLNMHYKSAALVKRKGASLLCTISCEDELFNIQGVFLFTYKITYIIIAADGKLYKGFYSPNTTIELTRLPISVAIPNSYAVYDPLNLVEELPKYTEEQINTQHEGFVYEYILDDTGIKEPLSSINYLGNYLNIIDGTELHEGDVVLYAQKKYKLRKVNSNVANPSSIRKDTITPLTTLNESGDSYWVTLDTYNTLYADAISLREDFVSKNTNHYPLVLKDNEWVIDQTISRKNNWAVQLEEYILGDVVTYQNETYICIVRHYAYTNSPASLSIPNSDLRWSLCEERRELIFQNYLPIEAATYKNILYVTTGTRFVQIELIDNDLQASIVSPYFCNSSEITNIGYNYLSPYPELCSVTQYNQAITSITGLLAIKQQSGNYILTPQMNFAGNETEHDYYFKWEKLIDNEWVTLISYKDNISQLTNYTEDLTGEYYWDTSSSSYKNITDANYSGVRYTKTLSSNKENYFTLEVADADKYQYRVSFAKSFDKPTSIIDSWDYNKSVYLVGDQVSIKESDGSKEKIYECIKEHTPNQLIWDTANYKKEYVQNSKIHQTYFVEQYVQTNGVYVPLTTPTFITHTTTKQGLSLYEKVENGYTFKSYAIESVNTKLQQGTMYWKEVYSDEEILYYNPTTNKIVKSEDWVVDKIDGEYFGQAASPIFTEIGIEDTFNIIHSCRKITSDGNKFLLYGDKYNSGSWYKTIINNPSYITQRGNLSFKTTKNEELIKVIAFNGSLIAFANSENIGGSIHLITGNGDDWDDQSGYYSPYKRVTINNSISCDNENTIQICENLLVFKYFDTIYYITSSELSNEVVSVYSCNDRLKHNNNFVKIPWDDNSCISEVTEDYYALLWKEKYYIEDGELVLERPAIRVKMYYKLGYQLNEKILYPWLRDESEYFNIDHIVYIKGKPIYLYNNTLVTMHENIYTDFGKVYKCMIHFRGEDIGYPKMYKLISNAIVYYHRNQYSTIDFEIIIRNEAGHLLLDNTSKRISLQDLRALREGDKISNGSIRLDSTILDSKVFNTLYKFPCLLADTCITSSNDKEFSLSSITYNYTTSETPDTTAYDLYSSIIRPKEVK